MSHMRSHPRAEVEIIVQCASGTDQGSGTLASLSLSGALLEETSIHPPLGALVDIRFRRPGDKKPLELAGTLLRYSASGFAIRFTSSPKIVRQILERGMLAKT